MTNYTTPDQFNITGGIDRIFAYANHIFPMFSLMLLLCVGLAITLGTYFGSRRFGNQPDLLASASSAAFIVLLITMFMGLVPGLIDTFTFVLVFVLSMIIIVGFFFSRQRMD